MILTVNEWLVLCEKQAQFDQNVLERYKLTGVPIWKRVNAYRVEAAE